MSFNECQAEHTRLRMKIVEFQQLVITGKLDPKKAQEFEKRMVGQVHAVEEKARQAQTGGGYVPRPGERGLIPRCAGRSRRIPRRSSRSARPSPSRARQAHPRGTRDRARTA